MPNEIETIERQLEDILKTSGANEGEIGVFKEKVKKMKDAKGRKLMALEVVRDLFKPLIDEKKIIKAIEQIKIEPQISFTTPIVKVPEPKVIVREVPPPKVIVNPTPVEVKASDIKFPKVFEVLGVKKMADFVKDLKTFWSAITYKNPLPVILTFRGKGYEAKAGEGRGEVGVAGGIIGGSPSRVFIKNKQNATANLLESATGIHIYNVALAVADTEYSQLLPDHTKRFKIYAMGSSKLNPHRAVLKYCMTTHGNDWSSVDYIPIPAGNFDEKGGLDLTSKTLYFQSPTGSGVVIIVAWV